MKILTLFLMRLRALRPRYLALLALPPIAAVSFLAISQATPSAHPTISLASEPLYARGTRDKPTLTLALSVEFPTVGAQYSKPGSASDDDTYNPATEYVGYFDAESCYSYNNSPTEVAIGAANYSDYKRFDRSGAATSRACGGTGFSGNFMNWATSSAVDMLRMGLTGGDRVIDTNTLTVLQRAVLPTSMFNDSCFPSKKLVAANVAGAVPSSLKGTHTGDVYIANCLNRVHFGTQRTGNCTTPGNNGNLGVTGGTAGTTALATTQTYFFSRVQVCSVSGSELLDNRKFNDENYCIKYPSGNYKPVGNLQKYSDAMRVSVFGYLNQSGTPRYGGVLRAPMKYVGPKYFDSSGVQYTANNPQVEWNVNTGVFVDNPESDAMGISGVVNYVNKFGRTGSPQGVYKTNDPVSELYYEALRYLQGLGPTSGDTVATSPTKDMTTTQKDGFPVYESWTDPHAGGINTNDYTCLKNNLFTIGDIGTHADKYIPGNTRVGNDDLARSYSLADNEPDFVFWTKIVGAMENGAAVSYKVGANSTSRTVNTSNPNPTTGNYKRYTELYTSESNHLGTITTGAGSAAYYMAGMAYWAKNHDIRGSDWTAQPSKQRPGMRVTTYMLDVNQNASSSGTDTRRKSQFFLTAKYGGFNDLSGMGNPYYRKDTGGTVISGGVGDTADSGNANKYVVDNSTWDKSNVNNFNPTQAGEARTHFLASDGRGILNTLGNIFATIAREGNSIAGGAISTQRLTAVGGYVYQAQFDAAEWTGDLVSQYVRVSNTNVVTISSGNDSDRHQWYASEKLNAKIAADPTALSRNIVVGKTTPAGGATATNYLWNEVDDDVKAAMNKATPVATADARGEDRLNFVRGVRTLEGTTVSGTAFRKRGGLLGDILNSGVAYSGVPSTNNTGSAYATFYTANKDRTKTLFVGANDGMLHAFNATNGEEIFGYIPSWLVSKLPALTNTSYNAGNHQSYLDGSPAVGEAEVSANNWKTVLVSGTGAGGQGVFALDVTNPDEFGASKVMWEFTDRDDADMGNVIGRPQILKMRTSAPGATTPTYKWFAVVPSGVNNNQNDGYFSTTGKPALFLLDLGKSSTVNWQENVNYYKISLPAGSTSLPSGIANFSATGGYSGEVNTAYLGDMQGRVWKLNFAAAGTDGWNIDTLSFFKSGSTAIPFYISKDASGVVQPITTAPALTRGPNNGVIVVLSTGKYLESSDNTVTVSTQVNSVFSILDNGSPVADSTGTPTSAISGRGRLKAGTMNATTGVVSTPAFTWGRAASDADTTQRSGWYADFPTSGERQVSGFGILGTKLVFGSVIPPNQLIDPCGSGSGYQYFVDVATGTGTRSISQVGLLGEPFVLELGADVVGSVDSTGKRTRTTKGQIILQGSEGIQVVVGDGAGGSFNDVSTVGRLSWRQINNYSELKSAIP